MRSSFGIFYFSTLCILVCGEVVMVCISALDGSAFDFKVSLRREILVSYNAAAEFHLRWYFTEDTFLLVFRFYVPVHKKLKISILFKAS